MKPIAAAHRFRSKTDAMNRRVQVWICLDCNAWISTKQKTCPQCGANSLQYFPSKAEAVRYAALRLEYRAGLITDLQLQPVFPVKINGLLVTTYRADFSYHRGGRRIIEDVKGDERHTTDVFKLKKQLVEAVYGITITVTT